jgi:hypothetical protein
VQDAQLEIEHYNVSRCDRSTRVGGGVLLYTHEDLPITNVETFDDKTCEVLLCTCETSKMVICVIYRPPDATLHSFQSCLKFVHEYTDGLDDYDVCFLGDFNFPNVDWDTNRLLPGGGSANSNNSADLLLSANLHV